MIGYLINIDDAMAMSCLVVNKKLLKATMKYWARSKKVGRSKRRRNFDSDPESCDKNLKTKVKSYNKTIITNFKNVVNNSNMPHK